MYYKLYALRMIVHSEFQFAQREREYDFLSIAKNKEHQLYSYFTKLVTELDELITLFKIRLKISDPDVLKIIINTYISDGIIPFITKIDATTKDISQAREILKFYMKVLDEGIYLPNAGTGFGPIIFDLIPGLAERLIQTGEITQVLDELFCALKKMHPHQLDQFYEGALLKLADKMATLQEVVYSGFDNVFYPAMEDIGNQNMYKVDLSNYQKAISFLKKLGNVFEAKYDDGTKTKFAVITAKGLSSLLGNTAILEAINDNTNGSSAIDRTYDEYSDTHQTGIIKNGYIVNIDLYQQVALLKAIEVQTGLIDTFGFYNLNGFNNVCNVLAQKINTNLINWFWTPEKFKDTRLGSKYVPAGLIYARSIKFIEEDNIRDNWILTRNITEKHGGYGNPEVHSDSGAVVFGIIVDE